MKQNRSAVVTGAGTGIGRAIFERLITDGWRVAGIEVDHRLAAEASEWAAHRGEVVTGSVTEMTVLETAADRAEALAPLLGWVNNAGLAIPGTLHEPILQRRSEVRRVRRNGTPLARHLVRERAAVDHRGDRRNSRVVRFPRIGRVAGGIPRAAVSNS